MVSDQVKLALVGIGAFFAGAFIARRGVHKCLMCKKCQYWSLEESNLVDYEIKLNTRKLNLRSVTEKLNSKPEVIDTAANLESLFQELGIRQASLATEALQAISREPAGFRKELIATFLILNNRASATEKAAALWEFYSARTTQALLDDLYLVSVTLPFAKADFNAMRLKDLNFKFNSIKSRWEAELKRLLSSEPSTSFVPIFSKEASFALMPHATRVWLAKSYRNESPEKLPVKTSAFARLRANQKS